MTNSEFINLTRELLSGELGSAWLKQLKKRIETPKEGQSLFDESAHATYWRMSQIDMVRQFQLFIDMHPNDIKQIANLESIKPEDNFNE